MEEEQNNTNENDNNNTEQYFPQYQEIAVEKNEEDFSSIACPDRQDCKKLNEENECKYHHSLQEKKQVQCKFKHACSALDLLKECLFAHRLNTLPQLESDDQLTIYDKKTLYYLLYSPIEDFKKINHLIFNFKTHLIYQMGLNGMENNFQQRANIRNIIDCIQNQKEVFLKRIQQLDHLKSLEFSHYHNKIFAINKQNQTNYYEFFKKISLFPNMLSLKISLDVNSNLDKYPNFFEFLSNLKNLTELGIHIKFTDLSYVTKVELYRYLDEMFGYIQQMKKLQILNVGSSNGYYTNHYKFLCQIQHLTELKELYLNIHEVDLSLNKFNYFLNNVANLKNLKVFAYNLNEFCGGNTSLEMVQDFIKKTPKLKKFKFSLPYSVDTSAILKLLEIINKELRIIEFSANNSSYQSLNNLIQSSKLKRMQLYYQLQNTKKLIKNERQSLFIFRYIQSHYSKNEPLKQLDNSQNAQIRSFFNQTNEKKKQDLIENIRKENLKNLTLDPEEIERRKRLFQKTMQIYHEKEQQDILEVQKQFQAIEEENQQQQKQDFEEEEKQK